MPRNSAEYQRRYRSENKAKQKFITVSATPDEYAQLQAYAKEQGFTLAKTLREATLHQSRCTQMRSKDVVTELKDIDRQLRGIGNNINQLTRLSRRIKRVVDENDLFKELKSLQEMIETLADRKLNGMK